MPEGDVYTSDVNIGCRLTQAWPDEGSPSCPEYAAACPADPPTPAELHQCMWLLSRAPVLTDRTQRPGAI